MNIYEKMVLIPRVRKIKKKNFDFESYFLKYYKWPYSDWSILDHKYFDFIIRFENLEEDFMTVLNKIEVKLKHPLIEKNVTTEKSKDFWEYYTPAIIPRAKRIFGPFLRDWNYTLPASWGQYEYNILNEIMYSLLKFLRTLYWRYIK